MGVRKKNNALARAKEIIRKKKRDENKLKRAAKPKTAGQKLHDLMHGRTS